MLIRGHKVHVDALEYRRDGLHTAESIAVERGFDHRIVVQRATLVDAAPLTLGGFPEGSSFPTPSILAPLLALALGDAFDALVRGLGIGRDGGHRRLQVFGHAEHTGDPVAGKALADRRAQLFVAMLRADVDTVRSIRDIEGWALREDQAMLRVLRCDPGAIDGEWGDVTAHAVAMFRREYRAGVFHRHRTDGPHDPGLADGDALDAATRDALIEAFVVACSPALDDSRLVPMAAVGCSELNPLGPTSSSLDRRLSILSHADLPAHHDRQPCRTGDVEACPIDARHGHLQCQWYRTHVRDPLPEQALHRHLDARWMLLPNGKILLSALTTVPDDGVVTFQIFRTAPVAGVEEIVDDVLVDALCEPKVALVRHGIAQLVWDPPADFSLDDVDAWLEPIPARAARGAIQRARVPVFLVEGGGARLVSGPPGDDLGRVMAEPNSRLDGAPIRAAIALDAFGRLLSVDLADGHVVSDRHALAADEPRVVGLRLSSAWLPSPAVEAAAKESR